MRNRAWRRQWWMALAGLLMIAAAVAITMRQRAPATPVPALPPVDPHAVALYVQHDGPALRVRWNPDTGARSGVLRITDGPRESRLQLGEQELRSGLASYWPDSRHVTFRLELDGAPAGEVEASVAAPGEERRPSPFPAPPAARRASVKPAETDGEDPPMPKPRTVWADGANRSATADSGDEEPKPSGWHRVTGKIPLLRRLRKHPPAHSKTVPRP